MTKFKPNFRALREQRRRVMGRRISLYEIGKASGVSRPTLTRWEDEEELTAIDASVASGLMRYFGCTLDELVTVVEEQVPA